MKKIAVIIFLLSSAAAYCASYDEALKLFTEKKYQDSLKIIAEELVSGEDLKPGSPNYKLRMLAGYNHWKLGSLKNAADHFLKCMEIEKKKIDPYISLALCQIEMKKYGEAEKTVRAGLKIEESAFLYYISGKISLKNQNYWRAKELFEKANSMNPELYVSYNSLGIVLMNLKKYSQANTAFSVALALKPDSAEILNNYGMSLEKTGKIKDAAAYFKRASDADPENKTIKENFSRIKEKSQE